MKKPRMADSHEMSFQWPIFLKITLIFRNLYYSHAENTSNDFVIDDVVFRENKNAMDEPR